MIILGLINFSDLEEERLFGRWKRENKIKKNQELMNKYGVTNIHLARRYDDIRGDAEIFGGNTRNINQLINNKSDDLEYFGPNTAKNNRYVEKIRTSHEYSDEDKKYFRRRGKYYDHPRSSASASAFDSSINEDRRAYRDYKEKLKESIKNKEEKIKHLKKIKNIKRAGLITLGAAGTAAATYGGYKYLKNKNKKED